MAADLSMRVGKLTAEEVKRIKDILIAAKLPVAPPDTISNSEYLSLMSRDKKNLQGSIRFVLLDKIGEALISADIDSDLLDQTLQSSIMLGEASDI